MRLSVVGGQVEWLPQRYTRMTLTRWATNGLRGIVLETLTVGGFMHTTEAALMRFFERLSAGATSDSVTTSEAKAAHEAAMKRLAAMGV